MVIFNPRPSGTCSIFSNRGIPQTTVNALLKAVKSGDYNMVREMLKSPNNLLVCDLEGAYGYQSSTLLHYAAEIGHIEMAKLLLALDKNAGTLGKLYTPLYLAAKEGKADMVKFLIEKGAHVNPLSKNDGLPLHAAAKGSYIEVVKLLIENGSDLDVKDENGYTSLHLAAKQGLLEIAKFLIDNGADINARNNNSDKPIDLAKLHAHKGVEQLLKDHGNESTELLFDAVKKSNVEEVRLLIEKNQADANAKDSKGYAPIHWAKTAEMADILIQKGADINAKDNNGFTSLHWAAKQGYLATVELLIKHGANHVKNKDGKMPSELTTDELIRAKLESYEKGEALKEIKDKLIAEKEEMKATLEKKLKEVMEEKKTALENLLKLQKGIRELQEEEPVIEKVLSEVKEEFSKCSLAKSLDSIVTQLDTINNELPVIAVYSSQSGRVSFEDTIDYVLKNIDSLEDKTKSKVVVAVTNMLNMLKRCGSESEDKLYTIARQVEDLKDNMPKVDDDFEVENYLALI